MAVQTSARYMIQSETQKWALSLTSYERVKVIRDIGEKGYIGIFKAFLRIEETASDRIKHSLPLLRLNCIASAAKNGHEKMVFAVINSTSDDLEKKALRGISYIFSKREYPSLSLTIRKSGSISHYHLRVARSIYS